MPEPLITLLIGTGILVFFTALFWPEKGLIARFRKGGEDKRRIRIEDALKFLYHCEYDQNTCSVKGLAESLSVGTEDAEELLHELIDGELAKKDTHGYKLTSKGRSYALRIIRIHRLYENYLAEETSLKPDEWHTMAEDKEHDITGSEAEELAAKLGNPLYDPHGDPIPTPDGEMPPREGSPLAELEEDQFGRIIHIEDEPETVYAQIVAEGLSPGDQVRLISVDDKRVRFEAHSEEIVLAPVIANNITVQPVKEEEEIEEPFSLLSELKAGMTGEVIGISSQMRGLQRRRLMDFGIVQGTRIKAELASIGNDPVAYLVRGSLLALRKEQAEYVYIKPIDKEKVSDE